MSILKSMTRSERTALAMLDKRDANEKRRLSGILGECITLSDDWDNTGSMAWFYASAIDTGHQIVSAARAAGFRCVRLFRTPNNAHSMPFTVTVETHPMHLPGPHEIANRFKTVLIDDFGFAPPVACYWIGGKFYLCLDNADDVKHLEQLHTKGVFLAVPVRQEDFACKHFHVAIPTGAITAHRNGSNGR